VSRRYVLNGALRALFSLCFLLATSLDVSCAVADTPPVGTQIGPVPVPPPVEDIPSVAAALDPLEARVASLPTNPVTITPDVRSLPVFVDAVMARLGLSVSFGPGIREREDPVSLRLAAPVPPAQMLRITREMLRTFAMSMTLRDGAVMVSRDAGARVPVYAADGRVPAQTDAAQRVLVVVPLVTARHTAVTPWLSQAFGDAGVNVDQDPASNTLLVAGPAAAVEDAIRAVRLLDQPLPRGRQALLLKPAFLTPEDLATELLSVLNSEGIEADRLVLGAPVVLLPLGSTRALAVFASDKGLLDHASEWARALDRRPDAATRPVVFSYPLRYLRAADVVETLSALPSAESRPGEAASAPTASGDTQAVADAPLNGADAPPPRPVVPASGRLAADPNRNAVMFLGRPAQWSTLYRAIRDMDVPPRSILVDVLIVELKLDGRYENGIEWLASGSVGGDNLRYGTLDGLGLGEDGFSLSLTEGPEVRAVLNLLKADASARVRVQAQLRVSNGQLARLDVGEQVPVLSSTSRSIASASALSVDSVDYRDTGLALSVRPTLRPDGDMDIDIDQSLSAAVPGNGNIDSPTIQSERLHTVLTVRQGTATVLGGLVSSETSEDDRRAASTHIPGAGAKAGAGKRRELLVLIRSRLI